MIKQNSSSAPAIVLSLLSLFVFYNSGCAPSAVRANSTGDRIDAAIGKAIDFLSQNQLPYGEFRTYVSADKRMPAENSFFDSSPFVTTFIVYSLHFVDDPRVKAMTAQAMQFLKDEMKPPGVWRFWTARNDKRITPDLDDTACASYILRKNGISVASNLPLIYSYQASNGAFYTWFRRGRRVNDIDCVVNADAVFYLGENERTQATCQYLNAIIGQKKERESSRYAAEVLPFYYVLSRAYSTGAATLGRSAEAVVQRILAQQKKDGSFGNELLTALAVCALLNFDHRDEYVLRRAVHYLLETQQENGSWARRPFFIDNKPLWYGSQELTTALCVEVLARYRTLIHK